MKKLLIALLFPASAFAQTVTFDVPPNTTAHVTISSAPTQEARGDEARGKCGMVAGVVKAIANQKESGMTKKQQMKILGESKFNRFWVDRVYVAPASMSAQDMHDVVYEQCMEQQDGN